MTKISEQELDNIMQYILDRFPNSQFEEDNDGQVLVYLGVELSNIQGELNDPS